MSDALDLEEMDADDRAELEAMLYAQVHHTTGASDQGMSELSEDKLKIESEVVENAVSATCAQEPTSVLAIDQAGCISTCVEKDNQLNDTNKAEVLKCNKGSPSDLLVNELPIQRSGASNALSSTVTSISDSPLVEIPTSLANVQCNLSSVNVSSTDTEKPTTLTVHHVSTIDLARMDNLEPETKTAVLAASIELPVKSKRSQFQHEVATIHPSLSEVSSEDDDDIDSGIIPVDIGSSKFHQEKGSTLQNCSNDKNDVLIDACRGIALPVKEFKINQALKSSFEVIDVSSQSSTSSAINAEVKDSDGKEADLALSAQPDAKTSMDPSSTSATTSVILPIHNNTPQYSSSHLISLTKQGRVTVESEQPGIALKRRARSLGAALTPAPKKPGQRLRTSSDTTVSDSDMESGLSPQVACNIQVNAQEPGGKLTSPLINESHPQQQLSESEDDDVEENDVETTEGQLLKLPLPKCRSVLRRHLDRSSPFIQQLSRVSRCMKWSREQRARYLTPMEYGIPDVDTFLQALPDEGWEIPRHFQPSPHGAKAARARYYNQQRARCRRCDEEGHVEAYCPLPPVCHLCGGTGHTARGNCPNLFCYLCGSDEHPERRCPRHVQPCFCALCKAKGHTSQQCPDKWRRYHVTTTANTERPTIPHLTLDGKPRRRAVCWMCGRKGHPGHHCGGDRYTSSASLSQQLISYTLDTCPSKSVGGIVATPAQMDIVFREKTRLRIERDTGAILTYEEMGSESWLINISGDLPGAQSAHDMIKDLMQGRTIRPRPRSAPASPAHGSGEERALDAGAGARTSAPASPLPDEGAERKEEVQVESDNILEDNMQHTNDDEVQVEIEKTEGKVTLKNNEDGRQEKLGADRALRRKERRERRREERRKRKLEEISVSNAPSSQNQSEPADRLSADTDVLVIEHVAQSGVVDAPKAKKQKTKKASCVELITVDSDEESSTDANIANAGPSIDNNAEKAGSVGTINAQNGEVDSDDPEIIETGPDSGLTEMISAARVWQCNLIEGNSTPEIIADSGKPATTPTNKEIKKMRKEALKKLRKYPGEWERDGVLEDVLSSGSDTVVCLSGTASPVPGKRNGLSAGKSSSRADSVITLSPSERENSASEDEHVGEPVNKSAKEGKCAKSRKPQKRQNIDALSDVQVVPIPDEIASTSGIAKLKKKDKKAAKAARLEAAAPTNVSDSSSDNHTNVAKLKPGRGPVKKRRTQPDAMPPSFCYMTKKLVEIIKIHGKDSPEAKQIRKVLNKQKRKARKWKEEAKKRAMQQKM